MNGSPGSSLIAVNRQTAKLRDEVVRLQAENVALLDELEAAEERAALVDEMAQLLAEEHERVLELFPGFIHVDCARCALLVRHAALQETKP